MAKKQQNNYVSIYDFQSVKWIGQLGYALQLLWVQTNKKESL